LKQSIHQVIFFISSHFEVLVSKKYYAASIEMSDNLKKHGLMNTRRVVRSHQSAIK